MTHRLLLTRPRPDSERFARSLPEAPGPVISPLMEIVPVDAAVPPKVAGLVLTSVHGAEGAARMGLPSGLPAWCVGTRTAEAARATGLQATVAGGDADGLVAAILAARPAGPLFHLRGRHARGDVAARLTAGGVPTADLVVYDQAGRPLSAEARAVLAGPDPVVAPVFSPRSATLLAAEGPFAAPLWIAAISTATAEAAAPLGPAVLRVAERPDAAAVAALTSRMLAATQRGTGRLEAPNRPG